MPILATSSPCPGQPHPAGDASGDPGLCTRAGGSDALFGWGNLINVFWCVLLAVAARAAVLRLRQRSIGFAVGDLSAVLTGVLLGLALPLRALVDIPGRYSLCHWFLPNNSTGTWQQPV